MAVRKRPKPSKNVDSFIEGQKFSDKKRKKHVISIRIPMNLHEKMIGVMNGMSIPVSINQWITEAILEKIRRDTK